MGGNSAGRGPGAREGSMAVIDRTAAAPGGEHQDEEFPIPYLGRSVRIVGPVEPVDPSDLPHPRAHRGELGKAIYNWRHSTIAPDPMTRIAFETLAADPDNTLNVRR